MFRTSQRCRWYGGKRGLRVVGLLWLAAAAVAGAWSQGASKAPTPALRVPLSELGFPGYAVSLFHAGASMATVHLLDGSHLLFTYSLRSLVPRLPGDNANDTDRQVAAVLVELPSGKIVGRAKWHLHDHGPYLWKVGGGVFAVRIGESLALMTPLQALSAGQDPFQRYSLPHAPGQPVLVAGSPDARMLMVEVEGERPTAAAEQEHGEHRHKHYTLDFYRLSPGGTPREPIQISRAGAVGSPIRMWLAMDGDGYLWAEDGQRGKWSVSFNEFGGKQETLAPVMSSCHPRLNLLSRSQFLVETCRGSDEQSMFAAYGFDGHENWQEQFGEGLQPPTLALAPEAGRFAMSRLVASSNGHTSGAVSSIAGDDPISQEIRVYQTESGDMLLHLLCLPAVRSAENFDVSPDGRMLVVLAPETLDLYRLPELSVRDRKDLAEVQAMTPPVGSGPVKLERIARPIAAQAAERAPAGEAVPAAGAGDAASVGTGGGTPGGPAGPNLPEKASHEAAEAKGKGTALESSPQDLPPSAPRKPPTLLKPGETPDFKGQGGSVPPK